MRQRKLKDLDERIETYKELFVDEPTSKKGKWLEIFEERLSSKPEKIYLEIGTGKGQFISTHGNNAKDVAFIGIEGQPSVGVVCAKKLHDLKVENVLLINGYINSAADYFEDNEINGVFLNFSDPWPKTRHEKRRLNHRSYLKSYVDAIKNGGFIKIKTDNDGLFEFGVSEAQDLGLEIVEITRDLHKSEFMEDNVMTEYEKKFSGFGKNINYMKINITK